MKQKPNTMRNKASEFARLYHSLSPVRRLRLARRVFGELCAQPRRFQFVQAFGPPRFLGA